MRNLRKLTFFLLVPVFAAVFTTDIAWSQRLERQSPQARLNDWHQGLQKFVQRNPELSEPQLLAIQSLAEIGDEKAFSTTLRPDVRSLFVERLGEAGRVLTHFEYLGLLRSFGDLRLWLVANELATQVGVDLPDCKCTEHSHCQSNICSDKACEPKGTTHTGVCGEAV